MMIVRGVTIIFCGMCLLITGVLLYGRLFPVPVVEWASRTLYWHDTRTGVNYAVLQPGGGTARTIISGVQIVPSPDNTYSMTITNTPSGLDLLIEDTAGNMLHDLDSGALSNIVTATWLDERILIIMRVRMQDGNMEITRFNVAERTEEMITTINNSSVILSPRNHWILYSDRLNSEAVLISTLDDRRYTIAPVATTLAWSGDGRYLAYRAEQPGEDTLHIIDTTNGNRIEMAVHPSRLLWSGNNRNLLVHGADDIVLFQELEERYRTTLPRQIMAMNWSHDDKYAYIIVETNTDKQVYLVDATQSQAVQQLATLPSAMTGQSWAIDDALITYLVPDNRSTTVYQLDLETGISTRLTRIPERIRSVRYYATLPDIDTPSR